MISPCYGSIVHLLLCGACFLVVTTGSGNAWSQPRMAESPSTDVLSDAQWARVDDSVDRALEWLANQQQPDGSFPTTSLGQPGVTSLCVMAFMAHGHLPGEGPYGAQLENAVGYILSCQKQNGILALTAPNGKQLTRKMPHTIGWPSSYSHAISSLTLSECFSTSRGIKAEDLESAISLALGATYEMQKWAKRRDEDVGGWRYLNQYMQEEYDSDLSATGWYLMSLRSAKNAGFDVPQRPIDEAVEYVQRCFRKQFGTFNIMTSDANFRSRGMAGAGILALAHAGRHRSPEAISTGDWILENKVDKYNELLRFPGTSYTSDRFHYGVFYCTQAAYQLGGKYWEQYFPSTMKLLLDSQQPDGGWDRETHHHETQFGRNYTTSLVLLAMGAPNQLLPIFQR